MNNATLLQTASLFPSAECWDEFYFYEVFYDSKVRNGKCRNDCLSNALAFAQLFVNIVNDDELPF